MSLNAPGGVWQGYTQAELYAGSKKELQYTPKGKPFWADVAIPQSVYTSLDAYNKAQNAAKPTYTPKDAPKPTKQAPPSPQAKPVDKFVQQGSAFLGGGKQTGEVAMADKTTKSKLKVQPNKQQQQLDAQVMAALAMSNLNWG